MVEAVSGHLLWRRVASSMFISANLKTFSCERVMHGNLIGIWLGVGLELVALLGLDRVQGATACAKEDA